jgi:hypothetical protein
MRKRIVPPRRPQNLRKGGGRKNSVGWTEQKRRTNRQRFDELRSVIKTAVTVTYPASATPQQLLSLNACNRNFCKEKGIPARAVWEGPGYHQHIALGIPHHPKLEQLWRVRLSKQWRKHFGMEMEERCLYWKPDIEPDKIASYLSKTRKNGGLCVKMAYSWMVFHPCWETGFRILAKSKRADFTSSVPRKNGVELLSDKSLIPNDSQRFALAPQYSAESEREKEPVCWRRWHRSMASGSCKCSAAYPCI